MANVPDGYGCFNVIPLMFEREFTHLTPTTQQQYSRLVRLAGKFRQIFNTLPSGIARAPGRVNLIGEHVDYEGYAVLPMAIEQDVSVAFSATTDVANGSNDKNGDVCSITFVNTDPNYKQVIQQLPRKKDYAVFNLLEISEDAAWTNYVLCGILGVLNAQADLQLPINTLQLLIDGTIPPACGLSSSSALVVVGALVAASIILPPTKMLNRLEMAELCRQAEHRIGTMGGGMDQAISCLAQPRCALHIEFAPLRAKPVTMPIKALGLTFVVANSMVIAQKAVDATHRFNKRVVECALAAKLIAKNLELPHWTQMDRLDDVHKTLAESSGASVSFEALQEFATYYCTCEEYTTTELEEAFGVPLENMFKGSRLHHAAKCVLAVGRTFKLKQRALHVWSEANRVARFRQLCSSESLHRQESNIGGQLGALMVESHRSCQLLYECSCPELDDLVELSVRAGALGARLTGAGWGGCIVSLVPTTKVPQFVSTLKIDYYTRRGLPFSEEIVFESMPSAGADIYTIVP